jgi:hypothetical protein
MIGELIKPILIAVVSVAVRLFLAWINFEFATEIFDALVLAIVVKILGELGFEKARAWFISKGKSKFFLPR